jgi:hypothetical protein
MLIAREKGFFAKTYEISLGERIVCILQPSSWKEAAVVEIEGKSFRFKREGAVSGSFLLLDVENVVAHAQKPSAFKERFEITHFSDHYALRKPSIWKSKFDLEKNGSAIGSISPSGFFRREILIDLPEEMPLILKVFIFWLALIIWKRQQHAGAAGG